MTQRYTSPNMFIDIRPIAFRTNHVSKIAFIIRRMLCNIQFANLIVQIIYDSVSSRICWQSPHSATPMINRKQVGIKGGIMHDGTTERTNEHDDHGFIRVDSKQSFAAKNFTSHFIRFYLWYFAAILSPQTVAHSLTLWVCLKCCWLGTCMGFNQNVAWFRTSS